MIVHNCLPDQSTAVILGAGPAGLTSAYSLGKLGLRCHLLEMSKQVGGISRTECYNDYYFDLGGHRFYTKHKPVEELWQEVLQGDLLRRARLSRIYYNNTFVYYPLRPWNTMTGIGLWNSLLILSSYLRCRIRPSDRDDNFEDWISNRFGRRLFTTFFKTYTEKVWGIPCNEIQAEWAQQRIKDLSVSKLLANAFFSGNSGKKNQSRTPTSLIEAFDYPKYGPGMMWQRMAELIQEQGSWISLNSRVRTVHHSNQRVEALELAHTETDKDTIIHGTHFLSSIPLRELVNSLRPNPPQEILTAADSLRYRDFVTVALIVNQADVFPDNWIYIHDPRVRVGRIQNFKNWSPYMVPDQSTTCLGLEYFCFEHDELWTMADKDLIDLASNELLALGLIKKYDVLDAQVVRVPKAYPIYDAAFKKVMPVLRNYLKEFANLQVIGRNGMHRYNNQDHSMLTGMRAAENILGAEHDLWQVNDENEGYLEEAEDSKKSQTSDILPPSVSTALAKVDSLALAVALGTVLGCLVFLITVWLLLKGEKISGLNLELLANFYWGYNVSLWGAILGSAYGFCTGFSFGWLFAFVKNIFTAFSLYQLKRKSGLLQFKDFLEFF